MLDRSSKPADALTEMLRGLRLEGVEYGRCRLSEPWALSYPPVDAARLHFVSEQGCLLRCGSGDWIALAAGDAVLLPHGSAHVLASGADVTPRPFGSCQRDPVSSNLYCLEEIGQAGASCTLLSGTLHFNIDREHPLMRLMPEVIRSCDLSEHEPTLPHLVDAMAREAKLNRVGAAGILARLADVLAASLIRNWVEHGCGDAQGWLAAVREPDIGRVLAAIHLNPERDWSVPALARIMGASRSGFAQRFATVVGDTPARYVARVRMNQARLWLSRDRLRVAAAAERLGYESEAAFSRAFKRVIGVPPSRLRARP